MRTFALLSLLASSALAAVVNQPSAAQYYQNDNQVLALAITVENFDTNYYQLYLNSSRNANAFTRQNFVDAGYDSTVYDKFLVLLDNEVAHVNLLTETLRERNGTTIPPCTYQYPTTTSVGDFVFYSKLFENIGTAAYDGAINSVYNKTLQQAAATIATVEARHAAYLNALNSTVPQAVSDGLNLTIPFPYPIDLAFPAATVIRLIKPFISSCPYGYDAIAPFVAAVVPVVAPSGSAANPSQNQVTQNDINTLNYALTLELLEATYYNTYLSQDFLSTTAFTNNGFTATQRAYLDMVKAHENMHVADLRAAISGAGATPTQNCTYNFGTITTIQQFLDAAANFETTGVSAYDGAVNTINDPTMRQTAAQIATVEARHASFIQGLAGQQPYSAATDTPLTPQAVFDKLTTGSSPVISACPIQITLPQVLTVYPYNNATSAPTSAPTTTGSASSVAAGLMFVVAAVFGMMF